MGGESNHYYKYITTDVNRVARVHFLYPYETDWFIRQMESIHDWKKESF